MPLFALANAGVAVDAASLRDVTARRVVVGVVVGLVVGKLVGVVAATWLAVRVRVGVLPPDVS